MQVERIALQELVLDPSNARKHAPKNLEAIKGSLAKFGQQKPIVVGKGNVVIAGNGTLEAARLLGWADINVVRTDLTGPDATAFAIADNRTGELAEWDAGVLGETLKALQGIDFDLGAIGFDADDLAAMIATPAPAEGLTDPDAVPENVETRCKPGDLWTLGDHRLLCGDSTNVQHVERLMGGERADIAYCDPPYGLDFIKNSGVLSAKYEQYAGEENQDVYLGAFSVAATIARDLIFWGGNFVADRLPASTYWIVWNKQGDNMKAGGPSSDQSDCEIAWTNMRFRKVKQYQHVWAGWFRAGNRKDELTTKVHPSQKPVGLAEHILNDHEGANVLDLFLGSGSTLIACEKTGRRCFGMEIDPKYCDVVIERWQQFTGKTAELSA